MKRKSKPAERCEKCKGEGRALARLGNPGHGAIVWVTCEPCGGTGQREQNA